MSNPIAAFELAALDCPDPVELARFYSRITGWPLTDDSDDGWAQLDPGGAGATLAFQKIAAGGYRPPEWPGQEHPQRMHVDFIVAALPEGVEPSPGAARDRLDARGAAGLAVRAPDEDPGPRVRATGRARDRRARAHLRPSCPATARRSIACLTARLSESRRASPKMGRLGDCC